MKQYQQAEDILLSEIPLYSLFYWRNHHRIKPWVKNYRPKMLFLDGWKDVIIPYH